MLVNLKYIRLFFVLVIALFVSGCGFHLRGQEKIPTSLDNIYIQSTTPYGNFEQQLAKVLRTYHINVVDNLSDANVILNIVNSNLSQVAGAVSANLQTRQYTLTYSASFQLLDPSNKQVIVDNLSAYSTTNFIATLSQMAPSSNVPNQYQQPLINDLVFRIINHLLSDQTQQSLDTYFKKKSR